MHLADGVISLPVAVAGTVVGLAATAYGLRRLREEEVPTAALLSAACFVGSLVQVKLGPSSVHLVLCALPGLLLGWGAVPGVLVGLVLQLVFFGHGGVTTLGLNLVNLALPAVLVGELYQRLAPRLQAGRQAWLAGVAGGLGLLLSALLVAACLWLSDRRFGPAAALLLTCYLPLAVVEGAITGGAVAYLRRMRPGSLWPAPLPVTAEEGGA